MTDADRAHAIVEAFRADGHPYYDELLAPIERALVTVRFAERSAVVRELRRLADANTYGRAIRACADRIERGEHAR